MGRVAGCYGLEADALAGHWWWLDHRPRHRSGGLRADAEVVLDAAGRRTLMELCGVEEEVLARALPSWGREEGEAAGWGTVGVPQAVTDTGIVRADIPATADPSSAPCTGDWAALRPATNGRAPVLHAILERRTALVRRGRRSTVPIGVPFQKSLRCLNPLRMILDRIPWRTTAGTRRVNTPSRPTAPPDSSPPASRAPNAARAARAALALNNQWK